MFEYRLIYKQGSQQKTWGCYKTKEQALEGYENFKEGVNTLYVNSICIKKYNKAENLLAEWVIQ